MDIKEKLHALISQYNLGSQVVEAAKVVGGLSHNMYRVKTDRATFAIKELNPAVMCRSEALRNFAFSERVARIARQNGINAVCALQFDGEVVLRVEDSFFMVFNWLNGITLSAEQVEAAHCEVVGQVLAQIHNISFGALPGMELRGMQAETVDLDGYIPRAIEQNMPYAQSLQNNARLLKNLGGQAARAIRKLNRTLTISHTDLDRKNVMWQGLTPFLIDWEASGSINPTLELVQVAWYWCGGDVARPDMRLAEAVIKSYVKEYKGDMCTDYDHLVYANMAPKIAWMEYNLGRSLCQTQFESPGLASTEVLKSMEEITCCVEQFDNIVRVLKKYV